MKRVREKKTNRHKGGTFHRVSPSITRTFSSILWVTLFLITWSTKEKFNKRKKKRTKTTLKRRKLHYKLFSLKIWPIQDIYRQRGHQGSNTGPCVETRHVAPQDDRGIAALAAFLRPSWGPVCSARVCSLLLHTGFSICCQFSDICSQNW